MKDKHVVITDFDLNLIGDFFRMHERQGPGGRDVTRKALGFLEHLPEKPAIADIGCGTGGQTILLSEFTDGTIKAVDLIPQFTDALAERVDATGLSGRITVINGSMDDLPFADGELDLIWAEGSISNIGYVNGLKMWNRFLKPGGYIAVSEATWFTPARPAEIEGFWRDNYAEIDLAHVKIGQMQDAGYMPVAYFRLSEQCWWDYFDPIRRNYGPFLERHGHSPQAEGLVAHFEAETDLYDKYKKHYGYGFYIGQKLTDR